ncbi:MAG: hypothetical protein PF489_07325 [Salinivirgaceae bacterium]|jgi:hypothetical protein|nr:hypothetical protein [Salinivirgaceae bacterium]
MKNIEDYIRKNKHAFDDAEPPSGHEMRFLNRLPKKQNNVIKYIRLTAVAATLLIMTTLSGLYIYDNWVVSDNALPTLADAGSEYAEAEAYFVSTISQQTETINQMNVNDPQMEQKQFEKDMQEMDSLFRQLQKDLKATPDDPRVINAMIKHYQIKMKVLNQIIQQLENANKIKNHKTQTHEKVSL